MPTPLIIGLKQYNKNPSLWTVPRRGTYQHEQLLTVMGSHKKAEASKEERYKKLIQDTSETIKKEPQVKDFNMLKYYEHKFGIKLK